MNKRFKFATACIILIVIIFCIIFYLKRDNKNTTYTQAVENKTSTILSQTASSTDQILLKNLKNVQFVIVGAPLGKQVIGDIVLTKELAGNTDIVTYLSIDTGKIKKFYLLQIRKKDNQFVLISNSTIDGADQIIGLRAAETMSQTEYYVDIQFKPINKQNETEGVIKTIGVKGIQEDTTL